LCCCCCRCDVLLPHQHSPRHKSASHPQCPPLTGNPAGNLVPARVGDKCVSPFASRPAALGLRSTLDLGILATGLWRVLAVDRAAFRIPLVVRGPFHGPWLASGAELRGYVSPPGFHRVEAPAASQWRFPRATMGVPKCMSSLPWPRGNRARVRRQYHLERRQCLSTTRKCSS